MMVFHTGRCSIKSAWMWLQVLVPTPDDSLVAHYHKPRSWTLCCCSSWSVLLVGFGAKVALVAAPSWFELFVPPFLLVPPLPAPTPPPSNLMAGRPPLAGFRVGDYQSDGVPIGRGATAVVYLGQHCASGELVAIKVISLEFLNSDTRFSAMLKKEITVLLKARHENVIRLYHFVRASRNGSSSSNSTRGWKLDTHRARAVLVSRRSKTTTRTWYSSIATWASSLITSVHNRIDA